MAYTYKGKTYKTKALMQKAQGDVKGTPTKNKGSFFDKFIKGDKFKKKAPASNVDSGRGGKDSARQKMYDKTSMFAKAADNRDKAKTTPGKARSFKDAFDAANKADKNKFLHKGKSYFTTKGAADNRDKMKTRTGEAGSMTRPTGPTKTKRTLGSLLKKIGSKLKKKK
jgi:hypothetical protein